MQAHRGRVAHRPRLPRIKTFLLRSARGTANQKYSVAVLPASTPLGVLLHHVADVHLGVACGDLQQAGRLRALLNVTQLSGARVALPFDEKRSSGSSHTELGSPLEFVPSYLTALRPLAKWTLA